MPKKLTIADPIGLHARPASLIVTAASKFKSSVSITYMGRTANAKSIMNLMALGVKSGGQIELATAGEDAAQAEAAIVETMKKAKLI